MSSHLRASLGLAASLLAVVSARPAAPQAIPRGVEFQVNSYTPSHQRRADVAVRGDRSFVVVWFSDEGQDGSLGGVFGRRFSSIGAPLAVEFQVSVYTSDWQLYPQVGSREGGDFVVAWQSDAQDGFGGGIFARRFNSSGAALGVEFQVNTYTGSFEVAPALGIDAAGDFVIAWNSAHDGNSNGVFARRFDAAGAALAVEFQVNTYTSGNQRAPVVRMNDDGGFVVVWESVGQDGSTYGLFGRRFASTGAGLASEFQVNSYTDDKQSVAGIGSKGDGAFVVVWRSYDQNGSPRDIFARRFDSTGAALAVEFEVNVYTSGLQGGSRAAMDPTGAFVVVWGGDHDGSGYGIFARHFDSAGVPIGGEFQVNTYTSFSQAVPRVDINDHGDFVVVWTSLNGGQDGDLDGVFAQRYVKLRALDVDGDGSTGALTDGLLLLRHLFGFTGSTLLSGAVDLTDCTRCDATSIIADLDQPLQVMPSGAELQVNTYTSDQQRFPAVGIDGNGAFVVAWDSTGEDGASTGVFARRFDAAGVALGVELQVNTYTSFAQRSAAVAMNAGGAFVVTWMSPQDGAGSDGVFARRFSSAGAALGAELQVNSYTTSAQGFPAVAVDGTGGFVVAWQSYLQDGAKWGVFARRFSSTGVGVGVEFQVNLRTADDQASPAVGMAAAGDFVVAWTSTGQEGYFDGVFARRFDAAGAALGGELQVNAFTLDNQSYPSVATASGGSFVVAWQSNTQDGYGLGVFARRFDAAGAPIGAELQVNQYTLNAQAAPVVAKDAGGFVVAWHSKDQDVSGYDVFARRFDDAANDFGPELRVNTTVASFQRSPAIAVNGQRDFVVAWQSYPQDGSLNGIFAQRFESFSIFDVDGNGTTDPLTDGLLALRYLFGFTGATLVSGAVGPGCTRCTAPAIEAYLAGLI